MLGTGPGIDLDISLSLQGRPILPASKAEGQPLVLAVGPLRLCAVSAAGLTPEILVFIKSYL